MIIRLKHLEGKIMPIVFISGYALFLMNTLCFLRIDTQLIKK